MRSDDQTHDVKDGDELPDLPERPVTDADRVKGGATPQPGGPVPIPYPNHTAGAVRALDPCI